MTLGANYGSGANSYAAGQQSAVDAAKQKLLDDANNGDISAINNGDFAALNAAGRTADSAQMGGYAGGANDASNAMAGLASQARGRGAPLIDTRLADQSRADYQRTHGAQGEALGLLAASAAGNGPSAANATFGANLGQQMQAQAGAANNARGGQGLAAANGGAMQAGGGAGVNAAAGAGQMRVGELQAARQGYLSGGIGMGDQSLAAQGQDFSQGLSAAQLAQRQGQMNQDASLAYLGLANNYQNAQLGADTSRYAADRSASTEAAAAQQAQNQALVSGGLGAVTGGASIARRYGNGGGQ